MRIDDTFQEFDHEDEFEDEEEDEYICYNCGIGIPHSLVEYDSRGNEYCPDCFADFLDDE